VVGQNPLKARADVSASIPTITRLTTTDRLEEMPTFSPDGRHIAFVALVGEFKHIFTREVGSSSATQLTKGNYDHIEPAWGPDTNTMFYARSVKESGHLTSGEAQQGGAYHSEEASLIRHDLRQTCSSRTPFLPPLLPVDARYISCARTGFGSATCIGVGWGN
jgi:Tol biopolymer transport system component